MMRVWGGGEGREGHYTCGVLHSDVTAEPFQ